MLSKHDIQRRQREAFNSALKRKEARGNKEKEDREKEEKEREERERTSRQATLVVARLRQI